MTSSEYSVTPQTVEALGNWELSAVEQRIHVVFAPKSWPATSPTMIVQHTVEFDGLERNRRAGVAYGVFQPAFLCGSTPGSCRVSMAAGGGKHDIPGNADVDPYTR
ncbi:hypothetical protein HYALB_00009023 [Hymenoscyphus albidus]|uniref:Uncharacterized protein n=1 Tax=Hymenoscyphus albidus TaxID=595503 RepID=A0A9N9Q346_9HELO|nr:hypothetical protein HYALB_00009023 [Hymenoscyphus albidus]